MWKYYANKFNWRNCILFHIHICHIRMRQWTLEFLPLKTSCRASACKMFSLIFRVIWIKFQCSQNIDNQNKGSKCMNVEQTNAQQQCSVSVRGCMEMITTVVIIAYGWNETYAKPDRAAQRWNKVRHGVKVNTSTHTPPYVGNIWRNIINERATGKKVWWRDTQCHHHSSQFTTFTSSTSILWPLILFGLG